MNCAWKVETRGSWRRVDFGAHPQRWDLGGGGGGVGRGEGQQAETRTWEEKEVVTKVVCALYVLYVTEKRYSVVLKTSPFRL